MPKSGSCSSLSRVQTANSLRTATPQTPCGPPLGQTWSRTGDWSPERSFTGEGDSFIAGAVPFWSKGRQCRKKVHIEHDLSWLYVRTKRHQEHPLHIAQNSLPKVDIPAALRNNPPADAESTAFKTPGGFSFWRDLRPPFQVISVRRLDRPTKEGERYAVTYKCDVDFHTEHSMCAENTYDVKIHGEATVILPDRYPETRTIQILDWGHPKMNWTPKPTEMATKGVQPAWSTWQPLAKELSERPTARRFQTIQVPDSLRRGTCAVTEDVTIDPVAKALLGRHDFNKLHRTIHGKGKGRPSSQPAGGETSDKPRRRMIVFTASAGFVPYEG